MSLADGGVPSILHCHSTFSLGGKEARACRLMNALGDRAQHTILSAMPDQLQAREAIAPGIRVAFPGEAGAPSLRGKPSPGRYRDLVRYMRGFDLVLSYNWGAMDVVGARRLFGRGAPPLIHHEDGFNADESERLNWKRNLFRRAMLPTAHSVVVPSFLLEGIARECWGMGQRLNRIANGIDTAHYTMPGVADLVPGFVRQDGDVVVGTIAGLRAVKDLPLLVRALALTPPNLRLVIAGEGPERAAIAAEAARCGVEDRVLLPGFVAQPWRVIGLFDIMALSSLSEQQPIAVIEAMAAGLPVVSPPVGDVPHMVALENRPFITERSEQALAAALTALAQDAPLRRRIGEANQTLARASYDESVMLQSYAALYGQAMGIGAAALLPSG